ncbi:MAG: hypothetical protein U0269_38620 [Polyangiales bacterium]
MMERRSVPSASEQLALFDAGEHVVPIEVQLGTRKPRRSRTRAWLYFVAIANAPHHVELRRVLEEVSRDRARGVLDRPMYELLSDAWNRRSEALRAARLKAVTPANEQRKRGRR